jgi:hypothetical protein
LSPFVFIIEKTTRTITSEKPKNNPPNEPRITSMTGYEEPMNRVISPKTPIISNKWLQAPNDLITAKKHL